METRRVILLMIFIGSLFLLWDAWMRQSLPPVQQTQQTQQTQQGQQAQQGASVAGANPTTPALTNGQTASNVPTSTSSGGAVLPQATTNLNAPAPGPVNTPASAIAATPAGQRFLLKNNSLELTVDSLGGVLVGAKLLDQASDNYDGGLVKLFDIQTDRRFEAQSGLVAPPGFAKVLPNHTVPFVVQPLKAGQDPGRTIVLASESGGVKLIKTFSIEPSGHSVKVQHTVLNTGADAIAPNVYLQFLRTGNAAPGESQFYQTFTGPAIYTEQAKFQKISFSDIEKGRQDYVRQANDGWLSIVQHYFVSSWVLKNEAPREFYTRKVGENLYTAGLIQSFSPIAPGAQQTHEALLYVGPQTQRTLEVLAPGLDLVVDYGFLTFLSKPIYWLLEQLHKLVQNWGWAIVLLTILIKLLFYPLSAASYRSMAKMKAVTPRLMALRERYPHDKAKLNQAMMELYKTEKINPLGGCLPVLVQIPVFLALYWVLLASVEMRNAPWILWISDLSSPDPFYILPIVMAITMFIQTKLNPAPPDPLQAKVMMFMPLVFSVFFFFFPAGLVLYWLINNVVSIAQQWVIMKRMNVAI